MSKGERGMKGVLPRMVTSFLYANACGRTTLVRLNASKPEWLLLRHVRVTSITTMGLHFDCDQDCAAKATIVPNHSTVCFE